MKTIKTILIPILCLMSISLFAQSHTRYENAMKQAVSTLHEADSIEDLQQVANQLERIAQAEPEEWLPAYYLGYAYIGMAIKSGGSRGTKYLELAQQHIDKLMKMQPQNSEVHTLQGYKHMIYVSADPANRGAEYTPKTMGALQEAIALNTENPRPYLLMGQMQYGVANFFGSSTEEACGLVQKALALYEKEIKKGLEPVWGGGSALYFASLCSGSQTGK